MTIGTLPEEVRLEFFSFYVKKEPMISAWVKLVQVCRRCRYIVFASPHPLHLQLPCGTRTFVKEMLDIWSAFPINIIEYAESDSSPYVEGAHCIIDSLGHNNRVWNIILYNVSRWEMKKISRCRAIQRPFPELTNVDFLVER